MSKQQKTQDINPAKPDNRSNHYLTGLYLFITVIHYIIFS